MQTRLICLLSGEVLIEKDGHAVAKLGRGRFLAEMSFLNHEPSTANVVAQDVVDYIAWDVGKLRRWKHEKPALWTKLQSVLGHDLIEKLKSISRKAH